MALAFFGTVIVPLEAQNVTIARTNDAIGVRVPGLGLIKGETLAQLKDGKSVRVEFTLAVLPGPGGMPAATTRQTFAVSYDLWEEKFAVTLTGTTRRAASYLTAAAAEAWCLEQLTVPIGQIGKLRESPFWIRLEYRIVDRDTPAPRPDDSGLTLRGMIEALSRRPKTTDQPHAVEAGPFRVQ